MLMQLGNVDDQPAEILHDRAHILLAQAVEAEVADFLGKHADMIAQDGATVPYPSLTKDFQHEVEMVVALKSGGANITPDQGLR